MLLGGYDSGRSPSLFTGNCQDYSVLRAQTGSIQAGRSKPSVPWCDMRVDGLLEASSIGSPEVLH